MNRLKDLREDKDMYQKDTAKLDIHSTKQKLMIFPLAF